ncbi:hypothetical protein PBCVCVB1_497L [Paramecium bursaria Chlorella virus CVB-1]|nr:hypothetical protein PBCVCVB1_497L [Paramecium bursaria Chlorella virus CVB-1]
MSSKQKLGQFFTTNATYILNGMSIPDDAIIIEPFAGSLDLIKWVENSKHVVAELYDICPTTERVIQRNTLLNPPDYNGKFVLTNPPYLARNKSDDKSIFDKYSTNDLYKCFLYSIQDATGGLIIIPAGFFMSSRDVDIKCRNKFMERFTIQRINYFEESVFEDTSITTVAILFERSKTLNISQNVSWNIFPHKIEKIFTMKKDLDWIVGGDIYAIKSSYTKIRRYVSGMSLKKDEYISGLTLHALDSGTRNGRIKLVYKKDYVYEGKTTSRSFATLCLTVALTEKEQQHIAEEFTQFIENKRDEWHSLFLPMYRESKEYSRKRIPFELAYNIVSHIISVQHS